GGAVPSLLPALAAEWQGPPAGRPLVARGDLNGDGRADLIFSSGGQLTVLYAQPGGGFQEDWGERLGGRVLFLAGGDFTGSGHGDLLTMEQENGDGGLMLHVLAGSGYGGFYTAMTVPVGGSTLPIVLRQPSGDLSITVGNLLGKGQLDLMIVS